MTPLLLAPVWASHPGYPVWESAECSYILVSSHVDPVDGPANGLGQPDVVGDYVSPQSNNDEGGRDKLSRFHS